MKFVKVKTRVVKPPKDDIYNVMDEYLPPLEEGDVLLITSKVLGIHQGECLSQEEVKDRDELIKNNADVFIPREECPNEYVILTIKENTLIPSAGIDESNANGYYILWPKEINKLAREICERLKQKFAIKKLAVIITDSHTIPLRRGLVGISIGFFGLNPLRDYRGKKDIFGRELKISQSNVVDSLATMAVLLMGEGAEQTPMVIVRDADFVEFTEKETHVDVLIPIEEDIFYPLLKVFQKKNEK